MNYLKLNKENLIWVKQFYSSKPYFGFWKLEEIFGEKIWNWDVLFEWNSDNGKLLTRVESNNIRNYKSLKLNKIEKKVILEALKRTKWVQKDAAKLLGVSGRALNYKIKHHEIKHPNWRVFRK